MLSILILQLSAIRCFLMQIGQSEDFAMINVPSFLRHCPRLILHAGSLAKKWR